MKKLVFLGFLLLVITNTATAQGLDWNNTLNKVIENSYDLKISQIDINISDKRIKTARSEYFPKISAYSYSEYSRNLGGDNLQPVYIGNDMVLSDSIYQSSLALGLNYNLFDFGIKKDSLTIAKTDKDSKKAVYIQTLRDLELKSIEVYARALLAYKEIQAKNEILEIQKEIFEIKEKLNKAGRTSKTTSVSENIKIIELESSIDKIKTEYSKTIQDLSFLTREEYDVQGLTISDFTLEDAALDNEDKNVIKAKIEILDLEQTPEFKIYDSEIEKKNKELSIAKKQNLPMFSFSTNYYFYGSDPSNLWNSYDNLSQRGLKFRLITSLPIFDGFKNQSERERLKLEIERLKVEKERKLSELMNSYLKYREDAYFSERQVLSNKKMIELVEENISMLDRLDANKLIEKETYLNQKMELINKKLETEQAQISDFVSFYRIQVITKYEDEIGKI